MKDGRRFHNFKAHEERKLVSALDDRKRSGKSHEDDVSRRITHVDQDGARRWSF